MLVTVFVRREDQTSGSAREGITKYIEISKGACRFLNADIN